MNENRGFHIAVFEADPAVVRVVSFNDDKSPVSKKMELKARKLAVRHIKEILKKSEPHSRVSLSDSQPKVFRAGTVILLIFELQVTFEEEAMFLWQPMVALTNTGFWPLEGACAWDPRFLSVNDKLYLTYYATLACSPCGDVNFFVYDVSSGTPKKIYENGNFSN
jgi:hypothetical protein